MITALHLGNFKAFADAQRIPVRPLTLLFGANSAGKSSVLHGLLMGRHALKTGDLDVRRTDIGGDVLDLGGFDQFARGGGRNGDVLWGAELDLSSASEKLKEMFKPARQLGFKVEFGREKEGPKVEFLMTRRIQVETDGEPLLDCEYAHVSFENIQRLRLRKDSTSEDYLVSPIERSATATYWLEGVNLHHPAIIRWLENSWQTYVGSKPTKVEWRIIKAGWEEICEWPFFVESLIPDSINSDTILLPEAIQHHGYPKAKGKKSVVKFAGLLVGGFFHQLFQELRRAISDSCEQIMYLGPLRALPPRRLIFPLVQPTTADGSFAWQVVAQDKRIRERINKWLGDPAKFNTPLELVARDWRAEGRCRMAEVVLRDRGSNTFVSHRDVGVGVSQMLPMIVSAMATANHIHAIEQPELHLHPALQAELGDVFIESALGKRKNTFLLETHSEHLILRILRRVRETSNGTLTRGQIPVTPDDVSVLYVQPTPEGSKVISLPVTPDGDFSQPWPGGFFAERLEDLP